MPARRPARDDLERGRIIANLSQQYRLEPDDLIYTGTPAGVGPVQPGDRLDGLVAGVGTLAITIGPGHA